MALMTSGARAMTTVPSNGFVDMETGGFCGGLIRAMGENLDAGRVKTVGWCDVRGKNVCVRDTRCVEVEMEE